MAGKGYKLTNKAVPGVADGCWVDGVNTGDPGVVIPTGAFINNELSTFETIYTEGRQTFMTVTATALPPVGTMEATATA